ncbi:MAG TPA: 4-phosphoerythronate dehydrogenase, partial [Phycisphaerae bacterium]|nr:4-phosphoerythronate dehydrogenase [Phycisphaerae bacterium]
IPNAEDLFSRLGEVTLFSGRDVRPADIRTADVLIVRSVTPVGKAMLDGSAIRFVATATAGIDHVDLAYLSQNGIHFADAAGCNAAAVADYVLTAMFEIAARRDFDLFSKTVGVVGCGRIGGIVADRCQRFGVAVLRNDPPLERAGRGGPYLSLEKLVESSDILTFHVPLTIHGIDATGGLIDDRLLSRMRPRAVLINTSRGEIAVESALAHAIADRGIAAVLDVWCNEPDIEPALVRSAAIATPHLAGYSVESKRRATAIVFNALAAWLGADSKKVDVESFSRAPIAEAPTLSGVGGASASVIAMAGLLSEVLPLGEIDDATRASVESGEIGGAFDGVRAKYAGRHEFNAISVQAKGAGAADLTLLAGLGFSIGGTERRRGSR